jgi:hypothetical protein
MIEYDTRIAGSHYYYASSRIEPFRILCLRRDYLNEFDDNAIEILYQHQRVGYVPKDLAVVIRTHLDQGKQMCAQCTAWVSPYEIYIKITIY